MLIIVICAECPEISLSLLSLLILKSDGGVYRVKSQTVYVDDENLRGNALNLILVYLCVCGWFWEART